MGSGITKLIAAGLVILSACGQIEQEQYGGGRLNIVATTSIIEDAVAAIAGDSADVSALMGPGVDPHLYKATQGDLETLIEADVVFYNGLHLEGKMGEVFEKLSRQKPVIAAAEAIDKSRLRQIPEFNNSYDPHIWFDVELWSEAVKEISKSLQQLDSSKADYYHQNTIRYLDQLDKLHSWVKEEIATIPESQRILITAHDAFGYFGEAYAIEVKGLQGISTLSEYGLRDVSDLVKFVVDHQVKAVFVETSVSTRSIDAVMQGARERGFDVTIGGKLYSDAMGEKGTPEGTYIGMVKANVKTIVEALK